jgi:putative nucleotidyltransferase with HDIG domain
MGGGGAPLAMRNRVNLYVGSVCLAAIAGGYLLFANAEPVSSSELNAIAILAILAAIADFLTFGLPRTSAGSLAFIPYLAAVMVVPSWATVAAATGVKLLSEIASRRDWPKLAFNVAQLTISLACAIAVYRTLGGNGLLSGVVPSLAATTQSVGAAAFAAFVVAFGVNTLLVQGVISLASGERFSRVVRENVGPSMSVDILASPIVFVFAWLYAAHGSIAAIAVWVPILGIRQLTKAKLDLEQTNHELLELMVRSIEARDAYTSGHSRRVRDYAEMIARTVGLSARDIEQVRRAALLHDVGKIHEKYAPILAKSDKLSPDEWQLMQQHPDDGAELVSTMTRLRDLIPAIRHHHEQWDGSGYPLALSGEQIPYAARIIALADTIDAMTSERPYRRAMTGLEVKAELIRCRGRQFDPTLVDKLLDRVAWEKLFGPSRDQAQFSGLAIVAGKTGVA